MKKVVVFLFSFLLCVGLVACAQKPSDSSSNITVTEQEITDAALFNKLSNHINHEYLSRAFTEPDLSEQYEKVALPSDEAEIENLLTEYKIIIEKCKNLNILISKEEAKTLAQNEYDQIVEDQSQGNYHAAISLALNNNSITEEEYLTLLQQNAYYKYNKIKLKNYFLTNLFDSAKNKTLDEQFADYIDDLVKQKGR